MPYIKPESRYYHDYTVDTLARGLVGKPPGELNYTITRLLLNILEHDGLSYTKLNEMVGVLECVKLELYRKQLSPYEDLKAEENGEVL